MIETDLIFKEESLTKEIHEYKRINAALKKKIHARDRKITYLVFEVEIYWPKLNL